jgi:hypothetical protein
MGKPDAQKQCKPLSTASGTIVVQAVFTVVEAGSD